MYFALTYVFNYMLFVKFVHLISLYVFLKCDEWKKKLSHDTICLKVSLFKKKNISHSTYSFNVDRHKDIQLCLLFIHLLQNLGRERQPPLKPLDKVYPSAMAEKKNGENVTKNKYYDSEYA